jgi:hypothetical protein
MNFDNPTSHQKHLWRGQNVSNLCFQLKIELNWESSDLTVALFAMQIIIFCTICSTTWPWSMSSISAEEIILLHICGKCPSNSVLRLHKLSYIYKIKYLLKVEALSFFNAGVKNWKTNIFFILGFKINKLSLICNHLTSSYELTIFVQRNIKFI